MLDNFKLITITHHKLNVNELENFIIKYEDEAQLSASLTTLKDKLALEELYYLATCNRVQLLLFTSQDVDIDFCEKLFMQVNPSLTKEAFEQASKFIDVYTGLGAIEHMFEVSSSIDSLVVGEREILRQYRQAYNKCLEYGITGDNLRLVDKFTVQAAKDVYANTKIGEKPVSVVSLAIQKLLKADLSLKAKIILIGAGETNKLVGKFLKKHGFENVTIFNRSIDNAKALSEMLDARAFHLSELNAYSENFDCIISCTGSPDVIVDPKTYTKLLGDDKSKKLLIDLAVPNNIDKAITELHQVDLIDIEKLRILANENLASRKDEVVVAKKILNEHILNFEKVYQQRQIEKALSDLPEKIKEVKKRALEKVYKKKIEQLDPAAQDLIQEMMDYMEKKCVGVPMKVAKATVG